MVSSWSFFLFYSLFPEKYSLIPFFFYFIFNPSFDFKFMSLAPWLKFFFSFNLILNSNSSLHNIFKFLFFSLAFLSSFFVVFNFIILSKFVVFIFYNLVLFILF